MSWDVFLINLPPEDFAKITDEVLLPMGSVREVKTALDKIKQVEWNQDGWGQIRFPNSSIEIQVGDESPVMSVLCKMRGSNSALIWVEDISRATGWSAINAGTGKRIEIGDMKNGEGIETS